jgi:hypothetical protein
MKVKRMRNRPQGRERREKMMIRSNLLLKQSIISHTSKFKPHFYLKILRRLWNSLKHKENIIRLKVIRDTRK